MTAEQFNQLQCICTLDGQCEYLVHTIDETGDDLPKEIEYEAF